MAPFPLGQPSAPFPLSPDDKRMALISILANMSQAFGQAARPSPVPQSIGSAIGPAAASAVQGYQGAVNNAVQQKMQGAQYERGQKLNQLTDAQIAEAQRKAGAYGTVRDVLARRSQPAPTQEASTAPLAPAGTAPTPRSGFPLGNDDLMQARAALDPEGVLKEMTGPPQLQPVTEGNKTVTYLAYPDGRREKIGEGSRWESPEWDTLVNGDPSTPAYALAYWKTFTQPKMQLVQTGQGMVPLSVPPPPPPPQIKPPTGAVPPVGPAAPPTPISARPAITAGAPIPGTQKPPTDEQSKTAGYYDRMTAAERRMANVEGKGYKPGGLTDRYLAGSTVGNYVVGSGAQVYRQAQEDWVRAKLRRESGAVIAKEEMEQEIKTYFPQPGDMDDVIEAKREAREIATAAMLPSGGRVMDRGKRGPAVGAVVNGYRFKGGDPNNQASWEKVR